MKKLLAISATVLFLTPAFSAQLEKDMQKLGQAFHTRGAVRMFALPEPPVKEQEVLVRVLLNLKEDTKTRIAAAKSLKTYARDNQVTLALTGVASDATDDAALREQTLKSLSQASDSLLHMDKALASRERGVWIKRAAGISKNGQQKNQLLNTSTRVRDWLIALADHPKHAESVRAMAVKALYSTNQNEIHARLLATVEAKAAPLALRKAAAWALFNGLTNDGMRDRMLDTAEDAKADMELRAEVLKSLFKTMTSPRVHDRVIALAKNSKTPEATRVAAVRLMQAINGKSEVEKLLKATANDAKAPVAVRQAALKALARAVDMETVRYFHLDIYNNRILDPLE